MMKTQRLHISSYRLSYWHATQRARHEQGDVLNCIFCQYAEGVALMKDVVAHLKRKGFPIVEYDDRSFIVELQNIEHLPPHDSFATKQALFDYIGGTQRS